MAANARGIDVTCQGCGWRGHRMYRQIDELPGPNSRGEQGFGVCRCGGVLVKLSRVRGHYVTRKRAAAGR